MISYAYSMKKLLDNPILSLLSVILSLISLTLIKIFPLYLGGATIKLLSTHVLAKVLLLFPFIFALLGSWYRPQSLRKKLDGIFVLTFLTYVFAQVASVIPAIDMEAYMRQFQNVFFHYVLFYVGYSIFSENKYKNILFTYLFGMGIVCIIIDTLFLFFGASFLSLIQNHIQTEMVALFIHNARMGRFNSYLVLDSFIPIFFLFYHASEKRSRHTALLIAVLGITLLFSYLSLFRTRFIQGVFALLLSLFVYFKQNRRFIVLTLLVPIALLSVYTATKLISPTSMTVIERFLLTDKGEDVDTIEYRYKSLQIASELLQNSPLVGVGLGNYKVYINKVAGFNIDDPFKKVHYEETLNNPHSIFIEVISETGIVGIVGYVMLLCYFLYKDIPIIIKGKDKDTSSIIVLAWTLFLYGIFNPFNTVYIAGWFWFMRGYIQSHYETDL